MNLLNANKAFNKFIARNVERGGIRGLVAGAAQTGAMVGGAAKSIGKNLYRAGQVAVGNHAGTVNRVMSVADDIFNAFPGFF